MSETKPKLRFWQFHLSTAIILSIVAAVILFLNIRMRQTDELFEHDNGGSSIEDRCGWPFAIYRTIPEWLIQAEEADGQSEWSQHIKDNWSYSAIAANLLVGTTILFVVLVSCEWLIRRREARKT
jgi:hypothetical protein